MEFVGIYEQDSDFVSLQYEESNTDRILKYIEETKNILGSWLGILSQRGKQKPR